jgi:ubiquinone biosynthesis monooxygenase Coq7
MTSFASDSCLTLPADLPAWLRRDLRSDHAGESGAVEIYRGILAVSRSDAVRTFATEHLETESRHLRLMDDLVPPAQRSRLTWLWRLAGWITGALPALFGPRAVFRTIEAVETFVDGHYADQVAALSDAGPEYAGLRNTLAACREDEVHHRDDARHHAGTAPGLVGRAWSWLVNAGSHAGVAVARRI